MEQQRAGPRDGIGIATLGVVTAGLAASFVAGLSIGPRWAFTAVLLVTNAGLLVFSALALAGAWRGSAHLRRAAAIGVMTWVVGPLDWALREVVAEKLLPAGIEPPWWVLTILAVTIVMTLFGLLGLAGRYPRARVLGIAGGWAGAAFFGSLLVCFLVAALRSDMTISPDEVLCLAMPVAVSALLVFTLSGRSMADHFAAGPRGDAGKASLTAGAVLNATIAILLGFYGLWCWHGPRHAVALAVAAVLGASAILTLGGRTMGPLLAVPGAVAAALLGLFVLNSSLGASYPFFLSPFTLAPALLALLLGLVPLARPMWSFVRGPQGRERPLP